MRRYASKPESVSRTLDACPRTSSQASISQLLQDRYFHASHVHPAPVVSGVVQAMSVRKEPGEDRLFAVSDDRKMVTGMNTPNHELYVESAGLIATMNQLVDRSKLFFRPASGKVLFDKPYLQVQAGFKEKEEIGVPKWLGKGVKTKSVNLDAVYRKRVAPAILAYRQSKKQGVQQEIASCMTPKEYQLLKDRVGSLTSALELFKKLVIYDQTTESYHDVINPMENYQEFIALVEDLVYMKEATSERMKAQLEKVADKSYIVKLHTDSNLFLQEELMNVLYLSNEVANAIPSGKTIDLFLLHRDNTEDAMIDSIGRGVPMFYRACDVMAATLMGNTIDAENKQQLKIYSSGGQNAAFHYAAKVLHSGNDWVTLESFAAGERETEIFGIDENQLEKNLDNSWNYLMYGSIRKRHNDFLSPEDNYFELYTKLRYYLKGVKRAGAFSMARRNKTNKPVPPNGFIGLAPGFTQARSQAIWERLRYNQILDEDGRVKKESFLNNEYIFLRLGEDDRPYAAAICQRMLSYYRMPSGPLLIQGGYNNEMQNIRGWINFMKLKIDTDELAYTLSEKLAESPSQEVYDLGWAELMKHL